MTRTAHEHTVILAEYANADDTYDLRQFARDRGIDTLTAQYGPPTGNDDEQTYVLGYHHNMWCVENPVECVGERAGWLVRFVNGPLLPVPVLAWVAMMITVGVAVAAL